MIWSISRMQNKVLGNAVLLTFWLIFSLFFTLGLLVIASSLKEIIFRFKPRFFPYLYILIGSIILHNTYKYFKALRARKAIATAIWMRSYLRSNKWPLTVSIIITALLMYTYYNAFFLKFGFIANLILFLPAFVLETLSLYAKLHSGHIKYVLLFLVTAFTILYLQLFQKGKKYLNKNLVAF